MDMQAATVCMAVQVNDLVYGGSDEDSILRGDRLYGGDQNDMLYGDLTDDKL
ncbi:MAG: hypothetical protein U5N55_05735 [Cypionkella sp.]|nr:hypothetical protein [Cypionkella sp.]